MLSLVVVFCCLLGAGAESTPSEYFTITDINGSYCTISGYIPAAIRRL